MGGLLFVCGNDCPIVLLVYEYIRFSHVNHGFNGKNHAGYEEHSRAFASHVFHFGYLVEFQSYPVPAKFPYHGITVVFGVGLDDGTDVTEESPWFGSLDSSFKTFFRDLH